MQWEVDLFAIVTAAPAIGTREGDAVAFVGTHAGRFIAVVVDGPKAGRVAMETFVDGIIWSDPWLPEPSDGRVYFGADDDTLYALSTTDGTVAWSRRLGACDPPRAPGPLGLRCDVDGGPTPAPGGDLYVGADGLYRIAREDGSVVWRYPADDAGLARFHVRSSPVTTEDLVVFGGQDGNVHAVDHDGHGRWTMPVGADVDGTAVVLGDGTIAIGADDGRVYGLDPQDGAMRWAWATGRDIRSGIARGPGDRLFVTSFDGSMYALSPSGAVRFIVPTQGPIASTPVVDAGGTVYFGSRDDRLYAVSTEGEVRFNVELPDDIDAAVAISPAGTLVVACDDGKLRGLR
jgi:outer membrane protein assembly factor BamB